jgi:uncharacterized membrane protein YphA (DoxX/SURF4 family)
MSFILEPQTGKSIHLLRGQAYNSGLIMRFRSGGTADRNALALARLRIAVGCLFLIFGQYKVFGTQFTLHGGFLWWINQFLQNGSAYPFMVPVLQRIVLPHATAVAFLVAYGELATGLALVLGIWVRAASAFGLVYMISLLLSSNYPGAHAPVWQYFGASLDHSVLALCFFTFIGSCSDKVLSIKKYVRGKRRATDLSDD